MLVVAPGPDPKQEPQGNERADGDPKDLAGKFTTTPAEHSATAVRSSAAEPAERDGFRGQEPGERRQDEGLRDGGLVARPPPGGTGWWRIFVAGSPPGEPSSGKQVVVLSMYGLALVGLGASTYLYIDYFKDADRTDEFIADHRSPGACYDFLSADCAQLEQLRDNERDSRNLANLTLATAGTLLLGGVLTATVWDNVQTYALPTPQGATLQVRLSL